MALPTEKPSNPLGSLAVNAKSIVSSLLGLSLLVVAALACPSAQAFPRPNILQRDWQYQFTYQRPKPISVRNTQGVVEWYWYMPYKVVNVTGEERLFIPSITIATEEGDIITAGKGVPAIVFVKIKAELGNTLLQSPAQVVGKFLTGEDFAKESVAIWPAFGHDISRMSIFIGGISGETHEEHDPVSGDKVLMNKTLMINFEFPGKPASPQQQAVMSRGDQWIVR